jgi:hypothetical protein
VQAQVYEGYFEQGGQFIPLGISSVPIRKRAIVTILDEQPKQDKNTERISRESMFGCMKGRMSVPDDFDAPLEDFKEYME